MIKNCSKNFSFFLLQAHLRRAYALTGLGATEEALIAHCLSICQNKTINSSSIPSTIIQDVAKVNT